MSEPVKPNTEAASIVEEEERVHARVQARVALGPESGRKSVDAEDYDRDLIELRDAIREAKPEDIAPLVEQMTRLAALRTRVGGGQSLPIDPESPYFAHMVLDEEGKRRDVLIGKRGFIDRSENVQIVDWRNAPISQIYYRYDEGDDYDEEISGRQMSGVVAVRRNVSIAVSRLRRIGAPQGTFVRDAEGEWHVASAGAAPALRGGQGKAARAPEVIRHDRGKGKGKGRQPPRPTLGVHSDRIHRADKHLPEIAALIDREQFELITQPESGLVVIQGGAGSGKTTVALHRIAYLNFSQPKRFKPSSMLFVVPSDALVRYVAAVLPALGVRGVPVMTYQGWARSQRLKHLRGSGGKYNEHTPDPVSRVKKHPALLDLLQAWVDARVADVTSELESLFGARSALMDEWRGLSRLALVPRLRELWRRSKNVGLDAGGRVAAESAIARMGREADDVLDDWGQIMTDQGLLETWLLPAGVRRGDLEACVRWCVAQSDDPADRALDPDGREIEALDGGTDEDSPAGRFDSEDDPILLRLMQMKRGALVSRDTNAVTYSHVAIDEAQDRSAIEVKVLLEATAGDDGDSSQKSVTIAGDTAQRLVFDNAFEGWDDLLVKAGLREVTVQPLRLSYRSTAEVMSLARDILGPELAPTDELVARSGAPVELHEFFGVGEAVAFLADSLRNLMSHEPSASVALLARFPEQADAYYEGLRRAEVPSLRRVRRDEFTFEPGIDVTEASQVKGLEFDYVIMVDVNASVYPEDVESRHLLHIAVTRAAHQLWLVSTATPSRLLPASLRIVG